MGDDLGAGVRGQPGHAVGVGGGDAAGEHRLPELRRVFALISEAYGRRTAKQKDVFGPQLLQALDNTIVALGRLPPEEYNVRLAAALAGLRRTLYPQEKGFAA